MISVEASVDRLCFEEVHPGMTIPSIIQEVTLIQLLRYAGATWNFYLLHLEKDFAQKKGFKDVNIHAPFFGAFLATMMNRWTGDPGCLRRLSYTIKEMGFPGDILKGMGKVTRKYVDSGRNLVECEVWVENQEGAMLVLGSATVSLPTSGG